ncbi:AI-2E family transporter [Pseudoclavibacter sp. CFCC 13611]|uniref:AI-2E family transporter n=1 Tax=Pseudoclavibacter sp. CFCC 13611 TaxID=2615178 RepID=UPI0013015096|nr:AI-2E family transporter [Pseudoclavibacter sp. CFCC 13611]KAB1663705.1 AI-2E family transporter [Pseudoclavibacter sp. CFCC 13611]KAB1664546.1 AI-2E family transporter [Pseudoclavibacter sp. CFCC 13611]
MSTPEPATRAKWLPRGPGVMSGFSTTVGVLLAVLLAAVVVAIIKPLTLVFFALFITLGLEPVIRWLESKGMKRPLALGTVLGVGLLIFGVVVWMIVPGIVKQVGQFVDTAPKSFDEVSQRPWFLHVDEQFNGAATTTLHTIETQVTNPDFWWGVGGGAFEIGRGVVDAMTGTIFVLILTLYFVVSLDRMKQAFSLLVPKTKRANVMDITEEITGSVGSYLGGMVVLAFCNAVFSLIVMTVFGVPFSLVLAMLALFITMIPLIGSVISTVLITAVALLSSPLTAVFVAVCLIIYMQVEAYVLTPRIVGKSVNIPGSLVLIGAMVGATLAGLMGALVAFPVAASILIIVKRVIVPAQEQR